MMMYRSFGRQRPQSSGFGLTPHPAPTGQTPHQSSYQAQYRPDFLQQKPAETQPVAQPSEITSNYERARAELTSPHLFQGPMTEKQSRDLAWQQRQDPRGVREQQFQNRRIYGASSPGLPQQPQRPSAPVSRPNFQGPRTRFTP